MFMARVGDGEDRTPQAFVSYAIITGSIQTAAATSGSAVLCNSTSWSCNNAGTNFLSVTSSLIVAVGVLSIHDGIRKSDDEL